ncbi:hypothetical protein [Jiangella mangrovi]|uniref:N-acetylmuramic acid 6-phosphate (MurNAc-6-P) etherase n=1 Tax=Jiangella mangrovi TaxID=1524084 RepID=A0A7W9GPR9_9ACTN|nr:hypothetical protein [Jiangella mangrovi]MBB5787446.1 N-acetylmuramic acid 6-phosphate (MurNAc-6-P) etherase [Jiangella mangrovi]
MAITASARKHGVVDDMVHAACYAIAEVTQGDRVLLIGAGRDGRLLEVVVLDPDTEPVIIHAMALRPKCHTYLPKGR